MSFVGPCFRMPALKSGHLRQLDPTFRQHWGSSCLSCKPRYSFFEGVFVLSTIVLAAISVFGLNLGRCYQSLVQDVALTVILVMLLGLRPYNQPAAKTVSAQAVGLLILTYHTGVSLLPSSDAINPAQVHATVVDVMVLVLKSAFVASVLWRLACLVDWKLRATLSRHLNVCWGRYGCVDVLKGSCFTSAAHKGEMLPKAKPGEAGSTQCTPGCQAWQTATSS